MSFARHRTRWGAVLLTIAVLVNACGTATDDGPSQFPNWPSELREFRFHWSAATGVDLSREPAVALRAYLESYRVVNLTNGDTPNVYPGFDRAMAANVRPRLSTDFLYEHTGVRPRAREDAGAEPWRYEHYDVFGYEPIHVLTLEPVGDGYRATVCVGKYSMYRIADDPKKFVSVYADQDTAELHEGDWELVDVWRIELTDKDPRTQDTPPAPSAPQVGPMPAPTDDVFGRWFITGASTGPWGPSGSAESIQPPEIRQACEDAMPDDAATRKAMATGFHTAPPPHGEPTPGWPAANG